MKLKATAFAIVAVFCLGAAPASSQAPAAAAKKKCKVVIKIVHGHKLRVCHTVKPSPPLPASVSVTLDRAHTATASITSHAYWNVIEAFHGNSFSFTIDDWDFGSSSFAHKVYAKTISATDATFTEYTTVDLRHTPE